MKVAPIVPPHLMWYLVVMDGLQSPGRVFKGKKMAGHLGNERVTVQNLWVSIRS